MNKYGCLIRTVDESRYHASKWQWSGFAKGESTLEAAKALAVSVKGYDEDDFDSPTEMLEEFIEDGYRFKLMKVESVIENHEIE